MNFLKRIGIFILSAISIFLLIILSLSFTLNYFLYPQIYLQTFEKAEVYKYINNNLEKSIGVNFIKISSEEFKPIIESLLSNFLSFMRSDTEDLNLTINIDVKTLEGILSNSLQNLKPCSKSQYSFDIENPCIPKGKSAEQFLNEFIENSNQSLFEKNTIDLAKIYNFEENSENRESLDKIREYLQYYQILNIVLIIIILILFLSIFLLQKLNVKKLLMTTGKIFIISSIFILIIIYLLSNINLNFLSEQLFIKLLNSIIVVLREKLILLASVMGIVGIILIISSLIIRNQAKTQINLNTKNKVKK